MTKVLVLTVGGSSEPLITSIKRHKPDYVIFLCSADRVTPVKIPGSHHTVDGDGLPCREWNKEPQPSIVVRAGLKPGEYEKIFYITEKSHLVFLVRDRDGAAGSCGGGISA